MGCNITFPSYKLTFKNRIFFSMDIVEIKKPAREKLSYGVYKVELG